MIVYYTKTVEKQLLSKIEKQWEKKWLRICAAWKNESVVLIAPVLTDPCTFSTVAFDFTTHNTNKAPQTQVNACR